MQRFGGFYKYRSLLVIPPLALVLFWPSGQPGNRLVEWTVGLFIFFAGLLGRIWAQQHLHLRLKMAVTLTTTGPYALVRNPIYICNTLICVGLTVISSHLWLVPVTVLWCAILYSMVVREEEEHIKQYRSAVAAYFQDVSRWLPRYKRKPLALTNKFFAASIWAESHNFLFLLPFLIKEVAYSLT